MQLHPRTGGDVTVAAGFINGVHKFGVPNDGADDTPTDLTLRDAESLAARDRACRSGAGVQMEQSPGDR